MTEEQQPMPIRAIHFVDGVEVVSRVGYMTVKDSENKDQIVLVLYKPLVFLPERKVAKFPMHVDGKSEEWSLPIENLAFIGFTYEPSESVQSMYTSATSKIIQPSSSIITG